MSNQVRIKTRNSAKETDGIKERARYEGEKQSIQKLLLSELNVLGISWRSDGTIEVAYDGTLQDMENFIINNSLTVEAQDDGHFVLDKLNESDTRPEVTILEQDKASETMKLKERTVQDTG